MKFKSHCLLRLHVLYTGVATLNFLCISTCKYIVPFFVHSACGGNLNAKTGVITSPGYPSPYPTYQNCLWTIHTLPNHHLRITLTTLDIAVSDKCKTDFLKLEHGHFPHQRKICGYYSNITYFNTHESTSLRFHTRDINSLYSSGFRMYYTQVPTDQMSLPYDLQYVTVNGQAVPYKRRLWVESQVQ